MSLLLQSRQTRGCLALGGGGCTVQHNWCPVPRFLMQPAFCWWAFVAGESALVRCGRGRGGGGPLWVERLSHCSQVPLLPSWRPPPACDRLWILFSRTVTVEGRPSTHVIWETATQGSGRCGSGCTAGPGILPPRAMSNGYSAHIYTPMTQGYGHGHKSPFIVLTCCTAAQPPPPPGGAPKNVLSKMMW